MSWKREIIWAAVVVAVLAALCAAPLEGPRLNNPLGAALSLAQEYAQQHVVQSLLPSLVLAGAIATFLNKSAVLKYLGPRASRPVAYGAASGSGGVLAVCSCSVLPLFASIYRMGAGIGPAVAFLYAAPAINVLAVILTASVLGPRLGMARTAGALAFGVVVGLIMSAAFGRGERAKADAAAFSGGLESSQPAWKSACVFAALAAVLVLTNWSPGGFHGVLRCCEGGVTTSNIEGTLVCVSPSTLTYRDGAGKEVTVPRNLVEQLQPTSGLNAQVYHVRYLLAASATLLLVAMLLAWYSRLDMAQWGLSAWLLARKLLLPFLVGILASGALLGGGGRLGLIPVGWIGSLVGGNSIGANFAASVAGALMYFATLTEVPIVQGLMNSGMGHGPALALLLAGPAVSLPAMLALAAILGWRKTAVYVSLVILLATICGTVFGTLGI